MSLDIIKWLVLYWEYTLLLMDLWIIAGSFSSCKINSTHFDDMYWRIWICHCGCGPGFSAASVLFVPTAPAPVQNPRRSSPPGMEAVISPAQRRLGRRWPCRDSTPQAHTSTRTLNCRASCHPIGHTCAAQAVYFHTCHSIPSCTTIGLLALNWLLLLWRGTNYCLLLRRGT